LRPKPPRACLTVALVLAAFAVYTAFVVLQSVTAAPPPHGHNRFWAPALVLLALLALSAAYGAVRLWRPTCSGRSNPAEQRPEGESRDEVDAGKAADDRQLP
jgi:hypothetical protein